MQAVNFLKISRIPASRNPRDRQLVAYQGRANEYMCGFRFFTAFLVIMYVQ